MSRRVAKLRFRPEVVLAEDRVAPAVFTVNTFADSVAVSITIAGAKRVTFSIAERVTFSIAERVVVYFAERVAVAESVAERVTIAERVRVAESHAVPVDDPIKRQRDYRGVRNGHLDHCGWHDYDPSYGRDLWHQRDWRELAHRDSRFVEMDAHGRGRRERERRGYPERHLLGDLIYRRWRRSGHAGRSER